jgi:hypothetical protein
MINRLFKSPSCTFIIYNRNVVSIDRVGTEDTILNDKYSSVAPSGRITKLTSVHLHQNKTNMKICLVLKILRNGCFVKVVLHAAKMCFKMFRKCTHSESTGGRQKVLYVLFGDFFSGLGAAWIVFKNLS